MSAYNCPSSADVQQCFVRHSDARNEKVRLREATPRYAHKGGRMARQALPLLQQGATTSSGSMAKWGTWRYLCGAKSRARTEGKASLLSFDSVCSISSSQVVDSNTADDDERNLVFNQ